MSVFNQLTILLLLLNVSQSWSLSFTPEKWDFEFVLGPKGQVMTKGRNCETTEGLLSGLSTWKKKLGERTTSLPACKCGKKELEKEVYNFFKQKLMSDKKVKALQVGRKSYYKKQLENICYRDLSGVMPKKFAELAKRQLAKDLDENLKDNTIFDQSGVNSFGSALEAIGHLKTPRFVSQYEFKNFIEGPLCQRVNSNEYEPGDIVSYHRRAEHWEDHTKLNGPPIHASVVVAKNLVFEKKGGHKDFPYQIAPVDEALQVTKGPIGIYRCKSDKEFKQQTAKMSEFRSALFSIEGLEKCLSKTYSISSEAKELEEIFPFVKSGLMAVEVLINEQLSKLSDPVKRSPFEGKELEYQYWRLLGARVSSMHENINLNLDFPNMDDYLSITNR